ncbi:hypothetical protein ACFLY2_02225 [Patescibacteria group bacterium]
MGNFLDFVEEDTNSFHLLISWVDFNLKKKYIDEKNIKLNNSNEDIENDVDKKELLDIENLEMLSPNFSEHIVKKLVKK